MRKSFQKIESVTIIGVGLMGGSLGLALRRFRPELTIRGVDEPSVLDTALKRGAITETASVTQTGVENSDMVVFATPTATTLRLIREAGPHIKAGAIVTDLCSVKRPIIKTAREALGEDILFVGGHPMAGSERSGISHAKELLYENATYILCPPDPVPERFSERYGRFTALLDGIGARILVIPAEEHDAIVADVSHLPQLLAVLLLNQAEKTSSERAYVFELAAGGFRDMTRIAGSSFDMWRDILAGNALHILDSLGSFAARLQKLRNRLAENDWDAVGERFRSADQARRQIPSGRKGLLNPLIDVFVFVGDRPGALVDITTTLFEEGLDIRDIELLKLREGTGGTFRLGFDSSAIADCAVESLESAGFQAYVID